MGPRLPRLTRPRFSVYSMCITWIRSHTLLHSKCKREGKQTCRTLRTFSICMTKHTRWWWLPCEIRWGYVWGKMREERRKGKGSGWRWVVGDGALWHRSPTSTQMEIIFVSTRWLVNIVFKQSLSGALYGPQDATDDVTGILTEMQLICWSEGTKTQGEMPNICWSQPLLNDKICSFYLVCIIANWISWFSD